MKKWVTPMIKDLSVNATNFCGGQTRDFPHMWVCNKCGAHNMGIIVGNDFKPDKCLSCGNEDENEFTFSCDPKVS